MPATSQPSNFVRRRNIERMIERFAVVSIRVNDVQAEHIADLMTPPQPKSKGALKAAARAVVDYLNTEGIQSNPGITLEAAAALHGFDNSSAMFSAIAAAPVSTAIPALPEPQVSAWLVLFRDSGRAQGPFYAEEDAARYLDGRVMSGTERVLQLIRWSGATAALEHAENLRRASCLLQNAVIGGGTLEVVRTRDAGEEPAVNDYTEAVCDAVSSVLLPGAAIRDPVVGPLLFALADSDNSADAATAIETAAQAQAAAAAKLRGPMEEMPSPEYLQAMVIMGGLWTAAARVWDVKVSPPTSPGCSP